MEEKNNPVANIVVGIIIGFILAAILFNSESEKKSNYIQSCEELVGEYRERLQEANETIENLNYDIEDAKSSAWGDYYDMSNALDNLDTADTIPEP
jgi:hypothetical protein